MSEDKERIVSAQRLSTDEANSPTAVNLRPSTLDEFVGQDKVCQNLKVFIQSAKAAAKSLTTFCFTARPDLEKPLFPILFLKNSVLALKRPQPR